MATKSDTKKAKRQLVETAIVSSPDFGAKNLDKIEVIGGLRQKDIASRFRPHGPRMLLSDILADIGSELISDEPGAMTKLENIGRVVVDLALAGDLWCINFIAERTEGKAKQSLEVKHTDLSPEDASNEDLLRALSAPDREGVPQAIQSEVERLVEIELAHRLKGG